MSQSRIRRTALAVAVLGVVGVAAAPAQAGNGHVGTWVQTGWEIDGRTLPCPVDLGLPAPAPSISCTAKTYLTLKKNGRYSTNMTVFRANDADAGVYAVVTLDGGKRDVIVFDDDGDQDAPRAYRVTVQRTAAGVPKALMISQAMTTPSGVSRFKMIFAPKAG